MLNGTTRPPAIYSQQKVGAEQNNPPTCYLFPTENRCWTEQHVHLLSIPNRKSVQNGPTRPPVIYSQQKVGAEQNNPPTCYLFPTESRCWTEQHVHLLSIPNRKSVLNGTTRPPAIYSQQKVGAERTNLSTCYLIPTESQSWTEQPAHLLSDPNRKSELNRTTCPPAIWSQQKVGAEQNNPSTCYLIPTESRSWTEQPAHLLSVPNRKSELNRTTRPPVICSQQKVGAERNNPSTCYLFPTESRCITEQPIHLLSDPNRKSELNRTTRPPVIWSQQKVGAEQNNPSTSYLFPTESRSWTEQPVHLLSDPNRKSELNSTACPPAIWSQQKVGAEQNNPSTCYLIPTESRSWTEQPAHLLSDPNRKSVQNGPTRPPVIWSQQKVGAERTNPSTCYLIPTESRCRTDQPVHLLSDPNRKSELNRTTRQPVIWSQQKVGAEQNNPPTCYLIPTESRSWTEQPVHLLSIPNRKSELNRTTHPPAIYSQQKVGAEQNNPPTCYLFPTESRCWTEQPAHLLSIPNRKLEPNRTTCPPAIWSQQKVGAEQNNPSTCYLFPTESRSWTEQPAHLLSVPNRKSVQNGPTRPPVIWSQQKVGAELNNPPTCYLFPTESRCWTEQPAHLLSIPNRKLELNRTTRPPAIYSQQKVGAEQNNPPTCYLFPTESRCRTEQPVHLLSDPNRKSELNRTTRPPVIWSQQKVGAEQNNPSTSYLFPTESRSWTEQPVHLLSDPNRKSELNSTACPPAIWSQQKVGAEKNNPSTCYLIPTESQSWTEQPAHLLSYPNRKSVQNGPTRPPVIWSQQKVGAERTNPSTCYPIPTESRSWTEQPAHLLSDPNRKSVQNGPTRPPVIWSQQKVGAERNNPPTCYLIPTESRCRTEQPVHLLSIPNRKSVLNGTTRPPVIWSQQKVGAERNNLSTCYLYPTESGAEQNNPSTCYLIPTESRSWTEQPVHLLSDPNRKSELNRTACPPAIWSQQKVGAEQNNPSTCYLIPTESRSWTEQPAHLLSDPNRKSELNRTTHPPAICSQQKLGAEQNSPSTCYLIPTESRSWTEQPVHLLSDPNRKSELNRTARPPAIWSQQKVGAEQNNPSTCYLIPTEVGAEQNNPSTCYLIPTESRSWTEQPVHQLSVPNRNSELNRTARPPAIWCQQKVGAEQNNPSTCYLIPTESRSWTEQPVHLLSDPNRKSELNRTTRPPVIWSQQKVGAEQNNPSTCYLIPTESRSWTEQPVHLLSDPNRKSELNRTTRPPAICSQQKLGAEQNSPSTCYLIPTESRSWTEQPVHLLSDPNRKSELNRTARPPAIWSQQKVGAEQNNPSTCYLIPTETRSWTEQPVHLLSDPNRKSELNRTTRPPVIWSQQKVGAEQNNPPTCYLIPTESRSWTEQPVHQLSVPNRNSELNRTARPPAIWSQQKVGAEQNNPSTCYLIPTESRCRTDQPVHLLSDLNRKSELNRTTRPPVIWSQQKVGAERTNPSTCHLFPTESRSWTEQPVHQLSDPNRKSVQNGTTRPPAIYSQQKVGAEQNNPPTCYLFPTESRCWTEQPVHLLSIPNRKSVQNGPTRPPVIWSQQKVGAERNNPPTCYLIPTESRSWTEQPVHLLSVPNRKSVQNGTTRPPAIYSQQKVGAEQNNPPTCYLFPTESLCWTEQPAHLLSVPNRKSVLNGTTRPPAIYSQQKVGAERTNPSTCYLIPTESRSWTEQPAHLLSDPNRKQNTCYLFPTESRSWTEQPVHLLSDPNRKSELNRTTRPPAICSQQKTKHLLSVHTYTRHQTAHHSDNRTKYAQKILCQLLNQGVAWWSPKRVQLWHIHKCKTQSLPISSNNTDS